MADHKTQSRFGELADTIFDVVVVGGGIIGAGIARDAALRGLQVSLFEKEDYGSGTTSASSRLVHGGLRYLEMLDLGLVCLDLRERETLLRIAPHLVRPLEFILPFYDRTFVDRWKIRLGMILYDLLSYGKSLPRYRFLTKQEIGNEEASLKTTGLQGGALYYDALVSSPERLCLENVIDARNHGACTLNYAQVIAALRSDGRVRGVIVRDVLTGEECRVRSRVVVNASGPWFDRVASKLVASSENSKRVPSSVQMIRTTKGVHLAHPSLSRRALVLFSNLDGRLFFVIPWLGFSYIGTTDTDFSEDPSNVRATGSDARYLLESAGEFFGKLNPSRVYFSHAGVRALVNQSGKESEVSRMHRIVDGEHDHEPGLVSVLGGKITGFRAIAQEITDLVCRKLNVASNCQTDLLPLPGGEKERSSSADPPGGDAAEHLRSIYGTRSEAVVRLVRSLPQLGEPIGTGYPDIAAQVVFSVREEQCLRVSDFMARRSMLAFSPDQGVAIAGRVAALMAEELTWSKTRADEEVAHYYDQYIVPTQLYKQEFDPDSTESS